jgi:hypothetical protein
MFYADVVLQKGASVPLDTSYEERAIDTASGEIEMTTAVPAHIEVLIDASLRSIKLGTHEIRFKAAAPSVISAAAKCGFITGHTITVDGGLMLVS